jgi:hypothetical protein
VLSFLKMFEWWCCVAAQKAGSAKEDVGIQVEAE